VEGEFGLKKRASIQDVVLNIIPHVRNRPAKVAGSVDLLQIFYRSSTDLLQIFY
jgi:hypothetical protein